MSGMPSGTTRSQPGDTRSDAAVAASPSAECLGASPAAARRRGLPPVGRRELPSASLAFQGGASGASAGQAAQSVAKAAHLPAKDAAPGSCFAHACVRRVRVWRRGVQVALAAQQHKPSNAPRSGQPLAGRARQPACRPAARRSRQRRRRTHSARPRRRLGQARTQPAPQRCRLRSAARARRPAPSARSTRGLVAGASSWRREGGVACRW